MTPCGHNFCRNCIAECLNRKHQCPLCNAECLMSSCAANLQFDNLLKIVVKEKEEASKRYFEKLFQRSTEGEEKQNAVEGDKNNDNKKTKREFSPVESLFQKHMRKSLAEFSGYHQTLIEKKEMQLQKIRDVYIDKMGKAKTEVESKVR